MDVGKRIRQLRKEHNMTTNKLAELCNTSQPVISKLENGHRIPDVPTIQKICEVFDMTLSDFFAPEDFSISVDNNLEELLNNAKELNPKQIKSLSNFLRTIIDKDNK